MVRHSSTWWAARVEELTIGRTAQEIARAHDISERTLQWWKCELRRRGRRSEKPQRLIAVESLHTEDMRIGCQTTPIEIVLQTKRGSLTVRGVLDAAGLAVLAKQLRS
jgi:transposase-like protein